MINYQILSDNELTVLLRKNDKLAFTEIYERYWSLLLRHAHRMLQDDDETKDVLQDVFSTLWNKSSELEINTSLSAYLYALVRNKILNHMLRNKVKQNYLASLDDFIDRGEATTDYIIRTKQLAQRIEEEVAMLPPKMREVFELSRKHHLSYNAISEKLNISDNTVKKQMSNALKLLKLKLGLYFFFLILMLSS